MYFAYFFIVALAFLARSLVLAHRVDAVDGELRVLASRKE
jgi:hypothetical protein